jgi:hypothetical protein
MMEKSAQPGGGGEGFTPTPCPYIYHHVQSCSAPYGPAERADKTPPISTVSLYVPVLYARAVLTIAFRLSSVAQTVWRIRIRDPLPFRPRDPGWVKKSGSRSGMYNPDHISKGSKTVFWVKILKFFENPGSGMEKLRNRDGKIRIRDPQHCAQNRSPYVIPVICRIRKQREHGT